MLSTTRAKFDAWSQKYGAQVVVLGIAVLIVLGILLVIMVFHRPQVISAPIQQQNWTVDQRPLSPEKTSRMIDKDLIDKKPFGVVSVFYDDYYNGPDQEAHHYLQKRAAYAGFADKHWDILPYVKSVEDAPEFDHSYRYNYELTITYFDPDFYCQCKK